MSAKDWPSLLFDRTGSIQPAAIELLKKLSPEEALIYALAWVSKLSRNEYSEIEAIEGDKVHLRSGLKGRSNIRVLARIEPFYSHVQESTVCIQKAVASVCWSPSATKKFFLQSWQPLRM